MWQRILKVASGVMILNSNRSKEFFETLPSTPELHVSSVDYHCPMLVSSASHSTFSFSFSHVDFCTGALLFTRQQLFQGGTKFPPSHDAIPDIGQKWIPKKEKKTESPCIHICPASVNCHPGIPDLHITSMYLIVLSRYFLL